MDIRTFAAAAAPLAAALVIAGGLLPAAGQEPWESRFQRLEQQNEILLQQNAELMQRLGGGFQQSAVYLAPAAVAPTPPPPAPPAEEWVEVGKNLDMSAVWRHGLWVETKDKAFKIHPGGRVQYDAVWMGADDDVQFAPGGVGELHDAANFRRARLALEGTFYEVCDFYAEFDFINTFDFEPTNPAVQSDVANTPVPTDLWVQITQLPVLGTFRAGNMKPPISFEHLTSSRFLNFMERSLAFDAFIG